MLLRRDARFIHEGQVVTHKGLHAAFLRGVRFLEDEGVFVVQVGHFRAQIDVEDTAFWVVSYDPATGDIELTDGSCERLEPLTLSMDADDVLRCSVKGGFPARFSRTGQAHLLDALEERGDSVALRVAGEWRSVEL